MIFNHFPILPNYSAEWVAIYLEPRMGSGERITIGIAAIDQKYNVKIKPVFGEEQLECLFSGKNKQLLDVIECCFDSLKKHLEKTHNFETWSPPFSNGVYLGNKRKGLGQDMPHILKQGLELCASFYLPNAQEKVKKTQSEKLTDLIRQEVQHKSPELFQKFSQKVSISNKANKTIRIDFLGQNYIANFGSLHSKKLSENLKDARNKLWLLSCVNDKYREELQQKDLMSNIATPKTELILSMPLDTDVTYSEKQLDRIREYVLELSEEAELKHLSLYPVSKIEDATSHIINSELKKAA